MSDLTGKFGLVVGVANKRSIAWGIAQALSQAGARLALTYPNDRLEENVRELAATLPNSPVVLPCDVTSDGQIAALAQSLDQEFGGLDCVVHSVAFAQSQDLDAPFSQTSRDGFRIALDVSAYSLVALARETRPLMVKRGGGSILTLTYLGSERVFKNYNVMGVAKAALEACVRYLAADLGPSGVRVNAISSGPVRTLSASGVRDFRKLYGTFATLAPLRSNITIEDNGKTAVWLASDLSSAVTGEVIYVDGGFNVMGVPLVEE